jgi:hypothetical protein
VSEQTKPSKEDIVNCLKASVQSMHATTAAALKLKELEAALGTAEEDYRIARQTQENAQRDWVETVCRADPKELDKVVKGF